MEEHKRKREEEKKISTQIWKKVRIWKREKETKKIASKGRREIKKRLKAKGIITFDEKIYIIIQREKNKLKQRKFTKALKETKKELKTIIEAKKKKRRKTRKLQRKIQNEEKGT